MGLKLFREWQHIVVYVSVRAAVYFYRVCPFNLLAFIIEKTLAAGINIAMLIL